MLRILHISNYALIDKLEINFSNGLTTITGETGAGKSILLGALSLVLGARSDTQILKNKELKCIVEATFNYIPSLLNNIFIENDIDEDELIILRREISPNGKTRAFVNDTPVNLPVLKEIGLKLIDIHSQHENLELNSNLYQLMVVDAFSGIIPEFEDYQRHFYSMKELKSELNELKNLSEKALAELDFLNFQYKELHEAHLVPGEKEELETEIAVLRHAEEIKTGLYNAWFNLSGAENNTLALLKTAQSELSKINKFHKPSEELQKRLESTIIEIKDISAEAESSGEKIALDPTRILWVEERLNLIYSLEQKHRLKTVEELIALKDSIGEKINMFNSTESKIEEMEKKLQEAVSILNEKADILSEKRENNFPEISKRIVEILIQLGMPNAQFRVSNEKRTEPGENGIDQIRFLFTANKKTELQDISKLASGGELSRLMLGVKYIISGSLGLPTIIFDEIDTGVSGEIAFKVGGIMKDMSRNRQVFAISHLPQVASKGNHHYLVYKIESDQGTSTEIRILNQDERIVEIARMLSGEQTTVAAMENAKELLNGA